MKIEALIIDPQNDFCAKGKGSLYVEGAAEDSERLAAFIERVGDRLHDIHVTLDTHHVMDVAHPRFWVDTSGKHPGSYDFQQITHEDVARGVWRPVNPSWTQRMLDYTACLGKNGRYPLVVWPEHCLIGSWGTQVVEPVYNILTKWERDNYCMVDYVTKGSNIWTEHYSAVQADVPDPSDDSTQLNMRLIETLQRADIIVLTGQALSHCVANTVRDIADNFGEDNVKKLVLLEDTTSAVTGFENLGKDFLDEMVNRGMQVSTHDKFLL